MSVITVSANRHTNSSAVTKAVQDIGLNKHDSVIALVKATEFVIAKQDAGAMKISAAQ
jgi:molybdopterin-binding protein